MQVKCFQYYPAGVCNDGADELSFEDVGLTVTFLYQQDEQDYVIRTLRLTNEVSPIETNYPDSCIYSNNPPEARGGVGAY